MENFFHNNDFYYELGDLMDDLDIEEENVKDLPDDYVLQCEESDLEPITKLSAEWICERINEERFPEDDDKIASQVYKILEENCDFKKINELMPKLYYQSRKKFTISKQDIIDYIK